MRGLQEIKQNSFNIMLLAPKILRDAERQKNFYVLDVSYCKELEELRKQVRDVAIKYQDSISSGVDNEDIKPHITVGGIDCDDTQPNLKEIENNIKPVIGKTIVVSNIVVFLYIKEDTVGKARLLEEMTIPFQP